VARYHNVYGPEGTWTGGRERRQARVCRKVIEAKHKKTGTIEIWGDGKQTRSFMYIDDCVKGTIALAERDGSSPSTSGRTNSSRSMACVDRRGDAGVTLKRNYNLGAPKGVNGPQLGQYDDQEGAWVGAINSLRMGWREPTRGLREWLAANK